MTLKDISIIIDTLAINVELTNIALVGTRKRQYTTSRAMLYNRKDIIPRAPAHSLCPSSALIHNARTMRPFLHFTAVAVEFENRMRVPASSASLSLSPYSQRRIKSYLEIVIVLRRRDPFVRIRTGELAGNCCPRKERKRITPYFSLTTWRGEFIQVYTGQAESPRYVI